MNSNTIARHKLKLLILTLPAAGILLVLAGFGAIPVDAPAGFISILILAGLGYLGLRFAIGPLSRFIGRIDISIRWKVLAVIGAMALLFFFVSVINIQAMGYMHHELHQIQELGQFQPSRILFAVNDLESTQHGLFFDLTPLLGLLVAPLVLGLGIGIAWSVLDPLRRMGQAMRRIASGDFSQPLRVNNRDELGDLADRINQAAEGLTRLQEATLAEERAHALRERIVQVTSAQEEERRRISRDLHDGLGPSLASIGNRIRACQFLVDTDPHRAKMDLEEIAKGMKGHVQEVRELIHDLGPLAVDQLGLAGAVEQQVTRVSQEMGVPIALSTSGRIALSPFAEVTVFRVVQECLTNVQKHANASRVEVELNSTDGGLKAMVKDNGRGFDTRDVAFGAAEESMGLLSMRERAELLGGSLSVRSSPSGGCEVALYIPTAEVKVGVHPSASGG